MNWQEIANGTVTSISPEDVKFFIFGIIQLLLRLKPKQAEQQPKKQKKGKKLKQKRGKKGKPKGGGSRKGRRRS